MFQNELFLGNTMVRGYIRLLRNVAFWSCRFLQPDEKQETHFHTIVNCITQSLKTQIIGRSRDEVAICFFNTVSCYS